METLIKNKIKLLRERHEKFVSMGANTMVEITCAKINVLKDILLEQERQKVQAEVIRQDNKDLLIKAVTVLTDIGQMCTRLTSGNVSHRKTIIQGHANRMVEFIEKNIK